MRRVMKRAFPLLLVAAAGVLAVSAAHASTETSLGDLADDGTTAFTGLAQSPEANLFTGALTTRIPIEVPPGRANMTPELALVYSSNAAPSLYGHGWDLPMGRIERSTKWGVPRCTGPHTNDFVLVLPDATAELVEDPPGSDEYRPKVEEAYVRAVADRSANKWTVYSRAGLRYTFGDVSSARKGTSGSAPFMSAGGSCERKRHLRANHEDR